MAVIPQEALDLESQSPQLSTPSAAKQSVLDTYNVKYRLDFFSNIGHARKWRLDILVTSAVGSITELEGMPNPVSIEWDGGDDINTPILGATCFLNLYQTDDYDLTEFFTADEFEFLVKVYYESTPDTYSLFWKGFIVQDEYIELIQDPPFQITVKALDKLALPEDEPINIGTEEMISPIDIIYECITRTGLEFDFIDCTNMKTVSKSFFNSSGSILQAHEMWSNSLYDIDGSIEAISYKDALDFVCRSYNARIFQRYGKLYFVPVQTYNSPSYTVYSHEYDYLSRTWAYSEISMREVLINTDIKNLGRDFIRTSTPSLKEYRRSYQVPSKNLFYNGYFDLDETGWTTNGGETIETDNSKTGAKSISFDASNIDDSVFDAASEATKNTTYRVLETSTVNTNALSDFDHVFFDPDNTGASSDFTWMNAVLSFWYFIDDTNEETYSIRYSLERNSTPNYYYDLDTGYLDKSVSFKFKEVATTTIQKWVKVEHTIRVEVPATGVGLTFRIYNQDNNGGGGTTKVYYDSIELKLTPFKSSSVEWSNENNIANYSVSQDDNENSLVITEPCRFGVTGIEVIENALFSDYDLNNKTLGQYFYNNQLEKVNFYAKTSLGDRDLEEWALFSMCSMYSAPTQRYEGTFADIRTSSSYYPLSMFDVFNMGYNSYEANAVMVLTRLTLNLALNAHSCQWLTVKEMPILAELDQTITRTYGTKSNA